MEENIKKIDSSKLYKLGFWLIILIMTGFIFGIWASEVRFQQRFDETIKLKGMLYKGKIYDITERPM